MADFTRPEIDAWIVEQFGEYTDINDRLARIFAANLILSHQNTPLLLERIGIAGNQPYARYVAAWDEAH